MAISINNTSSGETGQNAFPSSVTFSHTVNAGSNRLLIVSLTSKRDGSFSAVTYNGVALTKIRDDYGAALQQRSQLWYLIAPPVGTFNVVATVSGSINDTSYGGLSLDGVDQTSPIEANNGNSGAVNGSTNPSAAVTTVTNNDWTVIAAKVATNIGSITGITGTVYNTTGPGGFNGGGFAYYGPKTPAGSQSMGITYSGNTTFALSVAAIKPAAVADAFIPKVIFF